MYGLTEEQWHEVTTNLDFLEAYTPRSEDRVKHRKKYFEKEGHEVISYVDEGVSMGIYILKKGKTDGK